MRLKARWIIVALIVSVCFNILAVILLHIGDRMRWEYASANFYLANYEFWRNVKDNKVVLYRISDTADSEINVDNWKIIQRSLNPKDEVSRETRITRGGLRNFVAHNRNAAIELAGHLLLDGNKIVGKRIIDEIAQTAPEYYYTRVKEPPIQIVTLQEIGRKIVGGEVADNELLEYIEFQYQKR